MGGVAHFKLGRAALIDPHMVVGKAKGRPFHTGGIRLLFEQKDRLDASLD